MKKKLYLVLGTSSCMAAGFILNSMLNIPAHLKAIIVGGTVGILIYILLTIYKMYGIIDFSKRNDK